MLFLPTYIYIGIGTLNLRLVVTQATWMINKKNVVNIQWVLASIVRIKTPFASGQ